MKKIAILCAFCMLMATGCGAQSSEESMVESLPEGIAVTTAEGLDPAYAAVMQKYFEALDSNDFAAYEEIVYPPYQAAYGAYLESKGSSLREAFDDLCHNFDEDGYESWQLTTMYLRYYGEEPEDVSYFFKAYTDAGMLTEQFVTDCYADATEMRDVVFVLSARYSGDTEDTVVVPKGEMIVIQNAEGVYLFG